MAKDITRIQICLSPTNLIKNAIFALADSHLAVSDRINKSLTIESHQNANQIYCIAHRAHLVNKTTRTSPQLAKGDFVAMHAIVSEHGCTLHQLAQTATQIVTLQNVSKFYQTIQSKRILPNICNGNKSENLQSINMEFQRLVSHHQCPNLMGVDVDG